MHFSRILPISFYGTVHFLCIVFISFIRILNINNDNNNFTVCFIQFQTDVAEK